MTNDGVIITDNLLTRTLKNGTTSYNYDGSKLISATKFEFANGTIIDIVEGGKKITDGSYVIEALQNSYSVKTTLDEKTTTYKYDDVSNVINYQDGGKLTRLYNGKVKEERASGRIINISPSFEINEVMGDDKTVIN